jgi:hypothetical protein
MGAGRAAGVPWNGRRQQLRGRAPFSWRSRAVGVGVD